MSQGYTPAPCLDLGGDFLPTLDRQCVYAVVVAAEALLPWKVLQGHAIRELGTLIGLSITVRPCYSKPIDRHFVVERGVEMPRVVFEGYLRSLQEGTKKAHADFCFTLGLDEREPEVLIVMRMPVADWGVLKLLQILQLARDVRKHEAEMRERVERMGSVMTFESRSAIYEHYRPR